MNYNGAHASLIAIHYNELHDSPIANLLHTLNHCVIGSGIHPIHHCTLSLYFVPWRLANTTLILIAIHLIGSHRKLYLILYTFTLHGYCDNPSSAIIIVLGFSSLINNNCIGVLTIQVSFTLSFCRPVILTKSRDMLR